MNWNSLESLTELDNIDKQSFSKPVLIFKHSTRCGVSRMALKQFENEQEEITANMACYFLDLLNFRAVSNEIANRYSVTHESPQVLLIKDGKCIYHASHSDINNGELNKAVN
ncbi:MAG TPA: bacillithiol system redox-active protein YtxJ [Bacteroidia bacterium]